MIESSKLLAKIQFTHREEASTSTLCFYKLLRQLYERINKKYKFQQLHIHQVKRQHMLEKKECCMEKLFLATLWAKLLIITVNFGNKTKVFSENFGW